MTSRKRQRRFRWRSAWWAALAFTGMAALTAGALPAASAASSATVTAPPYSCAANGPAGNQTVYGTFGDASVLGWTGNHQGVPACLGGSFFVISKGRPGDGTTTPVTGTTYGYGVYDDSTTTWANADGYLPALVTTFHRDGARISITNFGDKVSIGGHAYVVIYSRVQVSNPTGQALSIDPQASAGLIPLNSASDTVPAHGTVNHDYAVAADRFGGTYAWPSASALAGAGGYDQHFAHMRAYWNQQLSAIAQIVSLPDASLADAYRTGFIYTQIIRSGNQLRTGANGYDTEFSHDVIGILANLFTQGYTTGAHALLDRARYVIGSQTQYDDGVWTYPWVWALYLLKTGDLSFVKANFATQGPAGKTEPSIKDTAHLIAADRTGPGGIMEKTNDIDANGYWTIDNYTALTGLATYEWLAKKVGNPAEAKWAAGAVRQPARGGEQDAERDDLGRPPELPAVLDDRAEHRQPVLQRRGRQLGGAVPVRPLGLGRLPVRRPAQRAGREPDRRHVQLRLRRLAGKLPPNTFGGYPTQYYSTAYNAGYGEWGLASADHRDQGILSYEFMISNGQSGPYSWWESQQFPNPGSPWAGTHPEAGNGSSPHAWGMANANMVLLDSIAAQRSDGDLVVGRGVPGSWLSGGQPIQLANFPTTDGHHLGLTIQGHGSSVTLTLTGQAPAGPVLFQLPAFVNNIASASAGTVNQQTGTVTLSPATHSVTVQLKHPAS